MCCTCHKKLVAEGLEVHLLLLQQVPEEGAASGQDHLVAWDPLPITRDQSHIRELRLPSQVSEPFGCQRFKVFPIDGKISLFHDTHLLLKLR